MPKPHIDLQESDRETLLRGDALSQEQIRRIIGHYICSGDTYMLRCLPAALETYLTAGEISGDREVVRVSITRHASPSEPE